MMQLCVVVQFDTIVKIVQAIKSTLNFRSDYITTQIRPMSLLTLEKTKYTNI